MAQYGSMYPGGASPLQQYAQPGAPVGQAQPGQQLNYPPINPQGANIPAGQIVYTTSHDASGQLVYHPFRAVPARYKTAQGTIEGIQWVPIDATSVLPAGAAPATGEVLNSVDRIAASDRSRDWGREDDRYRDNYRRRDNRDRRSGAWDKPDDYRREEDGFGRRDDRELRRAQERDERERQRNEQRRKSQIGYGPTYDPYGTAELERRFEDLGVDPSRDRDRREREREYERDGLRTSNARSRRSSMYGAERPIVPGGGGAYSTSSTPSLGYSTANSAGYPTSATSNYGSSAYGATTTAGYPYSGQRDAIDASGIRRPVSPYQQGGVQPAGSPYDTSRAISRPASPYRGVPPLPTSYAQNAATMPARPVSPYRGIPPITSQRQASPYHGGGALPPQRPVSPYHGGGALPPRPASPHYGGGAPLAQRAVSPAPGMVYPPGHIMAGKPIPRSNISRVPSPAPPGAYGDTRSSIQSGYNAGGGYGGSPQQFDDQRTLPAPEGFARPPNLAQPYTPFETMKIQDMDDFFENIPRMPLVLVTHDVYHEDWIRFMTDLSLSWGGKLPVPDYSQDGRPPKRTYLTADLIDLWNASFFIKRGVEAVLYKGRERRSGPNAGVVDAHLPGFEDLGRGLDDYDEDTEDSEDDDDYDDRHTGGAYGGVYGRGVENQMAELQEARRIRRERRRVEKKRRRQERRHRRRLKEAERKYALYLTCVTPRDPQAFPGM